MIPEIKQRTEPREPEGLPPQEMEFLTQFCINLLSHGAPCFSLVDIRKNLYGHASPTAKGSNPVLFNAKDALVDAYIEKALQGIGCRQVYELPEKVKQALYAKKVQDALLVYQKRRKDRKLADYDKTFASTAASMGVRATRARRERPPCCLGFGVDRHRSKGQGGPAEVQNEASAKERERCSRRYVPRIARRGGLLPSGHLRARREVAMSNLYVVIPSLPHGLVKIRREIQEPFLCLGRSPHDKRPIPVTGDWQLWPYVPTKQFYRTSRGLRDPFMSEPMPCPFGAPGDALRVRAKEGGKMATTKIISVRCDASIVGGPYFWELTCEVVQEGGSDVAYC